MNGRAHLLSRAYYFAKPHRAAYNNADKGPGYGQQAGSAYTFVAAGSGGGLQTTTIVYSYDPLYRLTNTSYTGSVTATYNYVYDSVGNMTAYTETVGANTTSVNRTFNAANQLVTATDATSGTTSYYYDANGNLTRTLPPGVNAGEAGEQRYSYNQRNLLLTVTTGAGSGVYNPIAHYAYDGDGGRVQQIDYSGSQAITVTYTNDNLGLSQVLIADNGATQTANLYGLDLLLQDDGAQTRTLLTDGLGSARQEMAGSTLETATTYEPYGNVLAQTGSSGTTYAFTGEQFDGAANLLYLRARYYNPGLKIFMSRDPFPGYAYRPSTQHDYAYVSNNPVNKTDHSGLCEEIGDDACWSYAEYMYYKYNVDWEYVGELTINQMKLLEQQRMVFQRAYPPRYIGDDSKYGPPATGSITLPPSTRPLPDGISVFANVPLEPWRQYQSISVGPVVGVEYLYNFHTTKATVFLVLGGSARASSGTVVDNALVSLVYNIGEDNLNYSGNFRSLSGSASGYYGVGATIGHAWTPGDFGIYDRAYSNSFMLACGKGAGITYSETEYIPLYTVNWNTGKVTYHAYEYLWYTGDGDISRFLQKARRTTENVVEKLR